MIFHIAGGQIRGVLAFKLGKQILRQFSKHVDQHIQATAMGHADHDLLYAIGARSLNQIFQQRN